MQRLLRLLLRSKVRFAILAAIAVFVLVWLLFFDTHSISRRIQWTQESEQLRKQNAELQASIEETMRQDERADSSEVIEKISREDYGMRKPGEHVYPYRERDDSE